MKKVLLTDKFPIPETAPKDISHIYYGNEFCDFLLPKKKDIESLNKSKRKKGIDFSIVIPYVNQRNFDKAAELLKFLNKTLPGIEIIVNDWGILHMIAGRFKKLIPVAGRLLNRQKQGFFVKTVSEGMKLITELGLNRHDKEYLSSSILQNNYILKILFKMGVRRIGLDNILQGINIEGYQGEIDIYYPYVYLTTSNYCLTANLDKSYPYRKKISACDGICRSLPQRSFNMCGKSIYLRGNTQFYYNDDLKNLKYIKHSRLIWTAF